MADPSSPLDLDEIYEFAVRLGKEAGSMLDRPSSQNDSPTVNYQVSPSLTKEKMNSVDLVTQTDEGQCHSTAFETVSPIVLRVCGLRVCGTDKACLVLHDRPCSVSEVDFLKYENYMS